MKKIDTSSITPIAGMPLKSGGLDHLQSAYQEGIQQMAIPIIGQQYNTTDYFIMQGCKNTGSGSNYIISAGSIYHNNEWFLVDAATFTAPMGQTAVGTITTTFFTSANADPTTFTDGVGRNVNVIRKIVFAAGVSGSVDVDFSGLVKIGKESVRIVGSAGEPGYQNSWTTGSIGTGTFDIGFRKDWSKNIVYFSGATSKPLYTGITTTVFLLPVGYRPSSAYVNLSTSAYTATGNFSVQVGFTNTGIVEVFAASAFPMVDTYVTFEGLYIHTD